MNAIKKTSKMRERSTHTKLRLLSILLMLCMVVSLLPMTAFATDAIVNKTLTISKTVEVGGNVAPPAETFEFVISDAKAGSTKTPEDYGIKFGELKIATNGEGEFLADVNVEINTAAATEANGWDKSVAVGTGTVLSHNKTFYFTEKNDGKANWTYDTERYAVTISYYPDGGTSLEIHEPGNDVYYSKAEFKNTYTKNEDSMRIPFKKTVTLGGNQAPGETTFNFVVEPYGNKDADITGLTITGNKIETNGSGEYDGIINIIGDFDLITEAEGLRLTEKNEGAANWDYDDTVYIISPGNGGPTIQKDNGPNMNPEAVDGVSFTNTYTKNVEESITIPFKKTVTLGGNKAPESTTFNFDIAPYGNESADISGLKITGNTITITGKGEYEGNITISGDLKQIYDAEGLKFTEKNDKAANWKYDETAYIIWLQDGRTGYEFTIAKDMGANMNPEPVQTVEFTNTYTKNEEPKPVSIPEQPASPQTGDNSNMILWIALLFVSCGGAATSVVVRKKRAHSK